MLIKATVWKQPMRRMKDTSSTEEIHSYIGLDHVVLAFQAPAKMHFAPFSLLFQAKFKPSTQNFALFGIIQMHHSTF